MKDDHRPVNVGPGDLASFSWPLAALTSITHRIAGVVLFIGIALVLYALDISLDSEVGFELQKTRLQSPFGMLITWGLLAALAYHLVAGIKHLLMDIGVGETLKGSQFGARVTLLLAAILMVLAGFWVIQG